MADSSSKAFPMKSEIQIINTEMATPNKEPYRVRSTIEEAKALVMSEPPALALRWPNVSIHYLHLNLMAVEVIWYRISLVGLFSA